MRSPSVWVGELITGVTYWQAAGREWLCCHSATVHRQPTPAPQRGPPLPFTQQALAGETFLLSFDLCLSLWLRWAKALSLATRMLLQLPTPRLQPPSMDYSYRVGNY
ncbi:hypothetical protein VPH35_138553 [Triticum aestivum]|uniref:Uncharacterized protein n=1 Tax=Aegilops tauschii subsp. strangulata TaxID=200361 RepID=A0A453SF30_AEGTS